MKISSIVAVSENGVIGVDNDLPWKLPSDLNYFKETTYGHHILMGRKNFDSMGRPLPGRTNIVVTRNKEFYHSALIIRHNILDGIEYARKAGEKELFIVGGAEIYRQTMDLISTFYLTRVHTTIENGDVFFPEWDENAWTLRSSERVEPDEKNPFAHTFQVYVK